MSTVAAPPVPERPLPTPTRESQPYWDGLRAHKLMLQHCAACGKVRHYPRPVCPHCPSCRPVCPRDNKAAANPAEFRDAQESKLLAGRGYNSTNNDREGAI